MCISAGRPFWEGWSDGAHLGFDLTGYKSLCREWAPKLDRYRRDKAAVGFGPRGGHKQRAYSDLVTLAVAHPPVVRVAEPDRDGFTA